ncbi:MAG: hypothetical protein GX149_05210, partial [Acholeplasmataceae bacterium]|nr:hypothetical protein [Acholeplasmataceae bacterium]
MFFLICSLIILFLETIFIVAFVLHARKNKTIISKETAIWFIPVFIINILVYITAYLDTGGPYNLLDFFNTISSGLKSFTFQIEIQAVQQAIKSSIPFALAFLIAYFLSIFTTVAAAIGLAKNYLINTYRVRKILKNSADIVIGFNETSLEYYKNNPDNTILWLKCPLDYSNIQFLYEQKIPFIKAELTLKNFEKKKFRDNIKYNFIAFEYEETNYQNLISEFRLISQVAQKLIFLFLEVKYEESEVVKEEYLKYQKDQIANNGNGKALKHLLFIRTFSRYELVTRKFVEEVTLPSLLPEDFFNKNRTIKEDKEINVFFLGFGKVNASLFTVFCQNNQLVAQDGENLKSKLVNYYVVDRNYDATNNKRIEYVVTNSNKFNTDFPQPEKLCNFNKINQDLNSYQTINQITKITNRENTFNVIVVSYGSDFENIETAMWLYNQFNEKNTIIACRVRQSRVQNEKIVFFGNESEVISREYIVEEKLQQIAKDIDVEYAKLFYQEEAKKDPYLKYKHWDSVGQIELYSNYYSGLNLRFKLNLLGFDLSENQNDNGVTKEEFMKVYDAKREKTINYFGNTTRNVLAYSEKLRWNAFYIFNGYRPMRKKDLKIAIKQVKINEKGQDVPVYEIYRKDPVKKLH